MHECISALVDQNKRNNFRSFCLSGMKLGEGLNIDYQRAYSGRKIILCIYVNKNVQLKILTIIFMIEIKIVD